jgi:hypothetical protein
LATNRSCRATGTTGLNGIGTPCCESLKATCQILLAIMIPQYPSRLQRPTLFDDGRGLGIVLDANLIGGPLESSASIEKMNCSDWASDENQQQVWGRILPVALPHRNWRQHSSSTCSQRSSGYSIATFFSGATESSSKNDLKFMWQTCQGQQLEITRQLIRLSTTTYHWHPKGSSSKSW